MCIFFSLWVCEIVGWLQNIKGNISVTLVGVWDGFKIKGTWIFAGLWDCGMTSGKCMKYFNITSVISGTKYSSAGVWDGSKIENT